MPGLRIVDAVQHDDGSWERISSIGHVQAPLDNSVQIKALDWMFTGPGDWFGYRAEAIRGSGGAKLAWFLGIIAIDQNPVVVAVALEEATPIKAQELGLALLFAARTATIP
jgi:hypothetical protein